jgi:hypothetical protein
MPDGDRTADAFIAAVGDTAFDTLFLNGESVFCCNGE